MIQIFKKLLPIIVIGLMFSSCAKDEVVTFPTFDEFVKGQSNLTMFAKAVEKANLQDFKNGVGPFTWFAPTDAAFNAAGITNDSLNRMTSGAISYLLTYHLINGQYTTENMVAVSSISRTTQMGASLYNGSFNSNYFVNGGKMESVDNKLSNGFMHVIDKFLTPPQLKGNIPSILASTGQHSLFIATLTKAGLLTMLSTTSIFTVMAPTDAAMNAAGYTTAFIAATSAAALIPLMRYHYFNSVRLFTNDFAADVTTIATAGGPSTSLLTSSNGTMVKGKGNATPVTITTSDILGTNGVVHIINGVLKP